MNEEQNDKKPTLRIGVFTSGLMIAVALIYDGAQALVELLTFGFLGWLINPLITTWSLFTFGTWFNLKGVSFIKPGRALTFGVTTLVEFIPFLNDLPTWTFSVIISLAQVYAEDVLTKYSPAGAKALGRNLAKPKLKNLAPVMA
jgi:hypothetical protein